jgi:hypothetical protein
MTEELGRIGSSGARTGLEGRGQLPRHDSTTADLVRDEAQPVPAVTWCPRLHTSGLGPFDQLGPVLARHFLGEAAHEHAPATVSPLIDLIHLERHVRVVRRGELRASSCAYHDHARVIKRVVHRKDERIVLGIDTETPNLLRSQQPITVFVVQDLQLGGPSPTVINNLPSKEHRHIILPMARERPSPGGVERMIAAIPSSATLATEAITALRHGRAPR